MNVGVVRNNVEAKIGAGALVSARGNIDVNALADKEIQTIAISGAGGVAAFAGSVTVWSIDDALASSYSVQQRDQNGSQTPDQGEDSLQGGVGDSTSNADSQQGQFNDSLGDTSDPGETSDPTSSSGHQQALARQQAAAGLAAHSASGRTDAALAASGDGAKAGVTAHIDDGAVITAGGGVGVRAHERIVFFALAGSGSGGAVGIGGSIVIVTIGSKVEAYIGNATVSAGGAVLVEADLSARVTGKAWGGQGGIAALGAQVVVITDNSIQSARIDSGADILRAGGGVTVTAAATRVMDAQAIGLQVGRSRHRRFRGGDRRGRPDARGGGRGHRRDVGSGRRERHGRLHGNAQFPPLSVAAAAGLSASGTGTLTIAKYTPTVTAAEDGNVAAHR